MTKDLIREHLMDDEDIKCDLLFVGNKGADFTGKETAQLGSVANEMIRYCKLNVVFMP